MNKEVFNIEHIYFDNNSETKDQVFEGFASVAFKQGYVKSKEDYLKGLHQREDEVTTGFKDGIAIPHCKNSTVIKPGVFLIKLGNPIEWSSLDGKPIKVAFGLAISEGGNAQHLKILSSIARKLIDNEFVNMLLEEDDTEKLYNIVSSIEIK